MNTNEEMDLLAEELLKYLVYIKEKHTGIELDFEEVKALFLKIAGFIKAKY